MKMPKKPFGRCLTKIFLISGLLLPSLLLASPVTIVHWGNSSDTLVSGHQAMTGGNASNVLDLDAFRNPAVGASYYNTNTGFNPTFQAAAFRRNDGDPALLNFDNWGVRNLNPDSLGGTANTTPTDREYYQIFLWQKPQFQNGFSAQPAQVNSLSIDLRSNGSSVVITPYFVIRLNTSFYITQLATVNVSSFVNRSLGDFDAIVGATWHEYDPTTDFSAIGSVASLTAADFSNVTAVGLMTYTSMGNGTRITAVSNFQATAIPEPGVITLILALVAGLWVVQRRRSAR